VNSEDYDFSRRQRLFVTAKFEKFVLCYENLENEGRVAVMEIIAPNLGQSGMDIKIETWFKAVGDKIEKGELLYQLSNEKLSEEVKSPESGTLVKILVPEGETIAPGGIIAEIE
jgi:biotin carboxyl carrier protein